MLGWRKNLKDATSAMEYRCEEVDKAVNAGQDDKGINNSLMGDINGH